MRIDIFVDLFESGNTTTLKLQVALMATENYLSSKVSKGLVDNLLNSCDRNLKLELVQLGAEYEHRLNLGQKPIFHLEAFVIAFMAIYKRYIEDALGSGMEW
ncbi:unnamed protein product [Schistosoma margrebowiei]|uniref:Uncharacterized protein n=1 Tax=Schistosoma margrebowiei TaxID=48269 RepID=A0A183M021_9TREM|nr:unnamed protein product [Schistosoma margrebowiei]